MAKSMKHTIGTRSGELISVPIELISVRLKDGTILGPKLYTGVDDKKHIENGYKPLDYNEEELAIILEKGWNRRRGSLLQNIDQLKASIMSAKRVLDPLDLITDGPYVVLAEGHRRHICSRWLQLEQFPISVIPAMVYSAGYGEQGNYENFEYQMWFRNQKEPLSIIEKYDFISEKLATGLTKEEFCAKVGIDSNEFDTIMLISGQSAEVRSLVEQNLISPTTLKIAKSAANSREWTQQQFEKFLEDSVKLATELGRDRVSTTFVKQAIVDYKPPEVSNKTTTVVPQEDKPERKSAKVRIKPTAKELEEIFLELLFISDGGVKENGDYAVYFPEKIWEKALEMFERFPDKEIEKVSKIVKSKVA